MATNRIDSLDPALIRPGRIDRKIEFPLPNAKTLRGIFKIHTSKMTLAADVNTEVLIQDKSGGKGLSGAEVKAICSEAGLRALRERRMQVTQADFISAKDSIYYKRNEGVPEGMFL